MKHAKLSPSSASRWLSCPASVRMTADIPNGPSSIHAQEGSVAHSLAELCLKTGTLAEVHMGSTLVLNDGFEMEINEELVDNVNLYLGYVADHMAGLHSYELFVEQKVAFTSWVPDGFGTSDAILLGRKEQLDAFEGECVAHIFDLKYGRGEWVSAECNYQAMIYALGVLETFQDYPFSEITLHIVQPRLNNFDSWTVSLDDLLAFGAEVEAGARLCLEPDAPFGPSEKACRWCPVSHVCSAFAQHCLETISKEFDVLDDDLEASTLVLKDPEKMDADQIGWILDKIPMIEKWCKIVAEGAKESLERGEEIPGYKLVRGRSNRRWTKKGEIEIVSLLGIKAYTKPKVVSPAEAEKLINKIPDVEMVEEWVFKPEGKVTLVKISDKRSEIMTEGFDNEL